MRLKETKDNWKASNVIRKIAEPPEFPITRGHKDTKKWCKGKPGVLHDYDLTEVKVDKNGSVPFFGQRGYAFLEFRCLNCKKRLLQGLIR
jgi:hypothetical protein